MNRDIPLTSVDDAERATVDFDQGHPIDGRSYVLGYSVGASARPRGLWIGAVLVAVVAIAALVVGWWARGAWG